MAAQAEAINLRVDAKQRERIFYTGMAIAILITVFAGFSRTWFLRPYFPQVQGLIPLLILHGSEDEVCPCWMAHALYDACCGSKRIYLVEGGLHKDLYLRDPDTMVWAVNRFATDLPRNTRALNGQPSRLERFLEGLLRHFRRPEPREAL